MTEKFSQNIIAGFVDIELMKLRHQMIHIWIRVRILLRR
jgi:hypothetical protein